MKSLKAAILGILLMAGASRAGEGIRILSADPTDNVLLEISTDIPRAVMSSSDLVTWDYVFFHVPPCQNFKAYAPQKERKQTYFKLAPAHSFFQSVVLSTEVPSLAGKRFGSFGWDVSFSEGGVGTLNIDNENTGNRENISYSIVDSRPGMISARTWIADGHKIDYLILIPDPSSPLLTPNLSYGAAVYAADRFGDFHSKPFVVRGGQPAGYDYNPSTTLLAIGTAIPPEPVNWVDPVGMVISDVWIGERFTLGPNGVATIVLNGQTETATYHDFVATGKNRATFQLLRSNGTRMSAFISTNPIPGPYREPGLAPYAVSGYKPMMVISYPGFTPH